MKALTSLNWSDVDQMYQNYTLHPEQLIKLHQGKRQILRGFKIRKGTIKTLIDQGHDEDIFLCFGVRATDISLPPDQREVTLMVCGTKSLSIQRYSIFDFLDPCPNNCPNNMPYSEALPVNQIFSHGINFASAEPINETIDVDAAQKMKCGYVTADSICQVEWPGLSGPLEGIWLKKEVYTELMKITDLEAIYISFAARSAAAGSYFTILTSGIVGNMIDKTKVYEYFDTCPPRNPTGFLPCPA